MTFVLEFLGGFIVGGAIGWSLMAALFFVIEAVGASRDNPWDLRFRRSYAESRGGWLARISLIACAREEKRRAS